MTSRPVIAALVLCAVVCGGPALALEPARDDAGAVCLGHAAAHASSSVAEPVRVVRGLDAQRVLFALPAPLPLEPPSSQKRPEPVPPDVRAAKPDVVTCPSQGPPPAR